ncbi:MAG TPA: hypothetical protein VFF04_04460 [Candidatus Babeliales bacterium]|nr:hypothetical protein [Candidatus Babeliales bacterium]
MVIFPLLDTENIQELKESLNHLHVSELKSICLQLELPTNKKKGALIASIIAFIETGKILGNPVIPPISKYKKTSCSVLEPETLILYGNYKNDHATRAFMKKLVGDHFHFTAFAQDWLHDRWLAGNPPTYKEFADYWTQEYNARKEKKASAKQEWAYINFVQKYVQEKPDAKHTVIAQEWQKHRQKHARKAENILKKLFEKLYK